jgi:hypothetical protein
MTTNTAESVNTNLSADQSGADQQNPLVNFDTSEADGILGGTLDVPSAPVEQQTTPPAQDQSKGLQLTPDQINQIRTQLQQGQQPVVQEQQQEAGPSYSDTYTAANAKFKEQTGLDFGAAIDEYMMATVGMPLKQTIETVQGMSDYINQRQSVDQIEIATQELRTAWGNNYDAYMQLAREEYDKLPQSTAKQFNLKKSLNSAQGAKFLLLQALYNRGGNVGVASTSNYNPFASPSPVSAVTNGNQPQLRMSQILAMNDAQYQSPEVQRALSMGAGRGYIDDINVASGINPMNQNSSLGSPVNPSQVMLG